MAQMQVINAAARPSGGKGAARAVRREGRVPAVMYGGDAATPENISLDLNELTKLINRGRFLSTIFEIDVGGKKARAIPRDVQLDPVKDTALHVDFHRIGADNQVRIRVQMRYINDLASPGLKRGGVLNVVRREVEVWAPADNVPEYFEADLTGLDIGRSIHISSVKLPEGVKPVIQGRDFTVATIVGAAAMKADVDEATPGATPAEGAAVAGDGKAPAADAKGAAPAAGAKGAPAAAAKPAAKPDAKGGKK